ncbi:hypothetical protein WA026_020936 [Henosepilachna vigintioctopunctata]|uniref:Uncharacterized protein n=1 Tax=Henosepilachna vigintioctopunctata TaxID=420089 RepID=A0AAW1UIR6_9CUCU
MLISMMSGHSPVSHHEMFEFKDGNSVPPSTSKEFSATENVLKTSVVLDATDSVPTTVVYSTLTSGNNLRFIDSSLPCVDDKVPLAEHEDLPNTSGTSDELKDDSKLCEDDRPDGTWSPKDEKESQTEEDICIKCLYVSMKCCECSIM